MRKGYNAVTYFYVAAYAFITETPIIYIRHFGVDPQYYGFLFGVNVVGLMSLSFFNRGLVNRFPLSTLLKAATVIASIAAFVLCAAAMAFLSEPDGASKNFHSTTKIRSKS